MTALCSGKICTIFPEKGALNFWKACTIALEYSDNGAGMDSETLAQLRHAIEHNVIDYEKHFGISNVSSRISNPLYGNGSVRIRSNPGNGTYVTIEFEQMEEDIDEKNNDRR